MEDSSFSSRRARSLPRGKRADDGGERGRDRAVGESEKGRFPDGNSRGARGVYVQPMAVSMVRGKARRTVAADLRVADLATFLCVHRCASVTGAARALGTSASQVSKTVARLETQLQVQLLSRGSHGVALTDRALRMLPRFEQVVADVEHIAEVEPDTGRALTLAAPSWMVELFLPSMAAALPELRFCGLELPPAMIRAQSTDNFFDLALTAGGAELAVAWHRTVVGELRLALFARPALAERLGAPPVDASQLLELPFITPVYNVHGRFVEADDDCPLGRAERRQGQKVQTIRVALAVAAEIDQLVFGPVAGARAAIDAGRIVEVPVRGWHAREPLVLSCKPLRVRKHEHDRLVQSVAARLRELDGG